MLYPPFQILALLALALLTGCLSNGPSDSPSSVPSAAPEPVSAVPSAHPSGADDIRTSLAGSWRPYTEEIFYDSGHIGALPVPVSRRLEISADGRWTFGTSRGQWRVERIEEEDWSRWNLPSYGPDTKIVLDGWNRNTADGPLELSAGRVDFILVIYRVEPPVVSTPGQIRIKFGH